MDNQIQGIRWFLGISALSLTLAALLPADAQQRGSEDVDHAGIIGSWTDANRERGRKIYDAHCYGCHGYDGDARLPDARSFKSDKLRAGSDPHSMWITLTEGFGQMVPQTQYTPEERYDVIHFIREVLMRGPNRKQYFEITDEYLASLPEGTRTADRTPSGHPRDFGPVLTSQFRREVNRAMTFDLGEDVFVTYDLHRMRQHYAWEGFLNLSETQHMRYRGERPPYPDGEPLDGLQTYHWAYGDDFDPAPENSLMAGLENSKSMGPTDPELMLYNGHYLDGRTATLSFAVLGREILERPRVHRGDDFVVLENLIRVAAGETALRLVVGEFAGDPQLQGVVPLLSDLDVEIAATGPARGNVILAAEGTAGDLGAFTAAAVGGDSDGLRWEVTEQHRLGLHIPASTEAQVIRVLRFAGRGDAELARARAYVDLVIQNGLSTAPDLEAVLDGGSPRWSEVIETSGHLNATKPRYDPIDYRRTEGISPFRIKDRPRVRLADNAAYVMDELELPVDNPWNAWMRMSALDFFDDGRLAVSTLGGDVWIVSGIDDTLEHLRWRRFATGLFEPLGLKIIDGTVYVTVRDGILRLHDLNGDGEADYYEDFYADPDVSNGFHAYNFDLDTDSEGNLYYAKPGRYTDYSKAGALLKISPAGDKVEVIARGFRVPNGLGIDPLDDTIYISGQEGQWVPASKITIVPQVEGLQQWLGVSQTSEPKYVGFLQPMIWMPRELDNSTASMLVVRDDRFGPLNGKLIHTSFGKGWIYYHMQDEVDGVTQAAVVALPFLFDSGVQRLRINPADGQLYTVGLTGWDTESTERDGSLTRVRYTGAPAYLLIDTRVLHDGVRLEFTFQLDPTTAGSAASYSVERWNYKWSARYGSDHYSVDRPGRTGNDTVAVKSATVAADGRSVFLELDDIRPVDQMMIRMSITATDGTEYHEVAYLTVHRVPDPD